MGICRSRSEATDNHTCRADDFPPDFARSLLLIIRCTDFYPPDYLMINLSGVVKKKFATPIILDTEAQIPHISTIPLVNNYEPGSLFCSRPRMKRRTIKP